MFLGLENSHDASKSTPWARKIKRPDDRLKFTAYSTRACSFPFCGFRFICNFRFRLRAVLCFLFSVVLAFRFRVVTVPLLYCLRGTETMCKLVLGCYCISPYAGHVSISPYVGNVSISPYAGHVFISPYAGHVSISPNAGHVSISPYSGHVHVSISPYAGHVSNSPYAGHVHVSISLCRLMRRRIKVADPRISCIREEVVNDNNIIMRTRRFACLEETQSGGFVWLVVVNRTLP